MRLGYIKSFAISCLVLPLMACSLDETGAAGGGVTVNWTAPVARADGSPLSMSEIGGYWIYYGTTEGNYPDRIDIDDGYEMQGTVTVASGVYYVVVTAYDRKGRESAFSSPALRIQI